MNNPTDEFNKAVESATVKAIHCPAAKMCSTCSKRKYEALASIQASTIFLLEGLKEKVRQGGIIRQSPYEVIDELIKELGK